MSNVQVQIGGNTVQVQVQSSGFARANAAVTAAAASATAAAASAASAAATLAAAALKANNLSDLASASTARTNLGVAIGSNVQAYSANLDEYAAVNPTAAGLALLDDADASAQRTTLGLGSIATQAASAVAITGGSIAGITDLAVADGGTGASSASAARDNLGLTIGTNVQAYDADLGAIAGLTSAADKMPYATGAGTWAMADLSPAARTVLDDTTVAGMRTTLGTDLAENVNYTPQGTGAIVRTVQTKLRERGVSVTEFSSSDIGNGVVDATDAFLAAFATGEDVFVPPTENSYKLSALIPFATNGQTVYGSGSLSRIIQTGTEADSIVFFGDVRANVRVRDLWLTPGTTAASQLYGFGVLFRDTAGIEVTGVQVTGHRRGGVGLVNCAQAAIFRNYVHDSIINPAVDDHSEAGADFLVINGGEDIDIFQNWSIDGSGMGVGVISQLSAPGFTYKRIRIFDNLIRGQGQYGVLGYRSQMTDVFQGFDVCRNTIEDITGDIAHSADGKVYGAGVYIQGVEGSRVNDNSIRRTNTGTLVEQLAPAAIGIANCRDVDASRNLIEDCDWYGLMATDTNIQGVAGGVGTFLDNTIRRSGKDGVYLKDFPLAVVSGESSGSTGGAGLLAKDVGAAISELYDIRNFRALGNSGVGVRVEDGSATYTNVRATGNQSGALVDGTGTHKFVGGQYSGNTNWGIVPNSANPNVETKNVTFGSNGFSDIYNDVPVKGLETNTYPSGTPFGGPYAEPRTLANSASPSVKNGRRFVTGGTTTITSLADLTIDQEVIIKAAHTVTVLGQALTSGKVLTAYNDGSGAVVKSVSP